MHSHEMISVGHQHCMISSSEGSSGHSSNLASCVIPWGTQWPERQHEGRATMELPPQCFPLAVCCSILLVYQHPALSGRLFSFLGSSGSFHRFHLSIHPSIHLRFLYCHPSHKYLSAFHVNSIAKFLVGFMESLTLCLLWDSEIWLGETFGEGSWGWKGFENKSSVGIVSVTHGRKAVSKR